MKSKQYEVEVWTYEGEYNMMFDNYDDAKQEYDAAVEEFGNTNVVLHDYTLSQGGK